MNLLLYEIGKPSEKQGLFVIVGELKWGGGLSMWNKLNSFNYKLYMYSQKVDMISFTDGHGGNQI